MPVPINYRARFVDENGLLTREASLVLAQLVRDVDGGSFQDASTILDGLAAMGGSTGLVAQITGTGFTKRSIAGTSPVSVTNGDGVSDNPTVSVSAASESATGVVELATNAETVTGTDTTRACHPAGVAAAVTAKIATTAATIENRASTPVTVTNTTDETTVYTYTVPGGTLSTNKMLRLRINASYTKNAAGDLTIRAKYGATTIATSTISDASLGNSADARGCVIEVALMGEDATDDQSVTMLTVIGQTARAAEATSPAEDSTTDLALAVTLQFSAASASLSATMHGAVLELL